MATGVVWLLFLAFTSSFSFVFADELALVIGQSRSQQIVPRLLLENSPGAKPGVSVLAERVHIYGMSRLKNLKRFSHAVTVNVSLLRLNSSRRLPNFEICFHRNLSLGVGMCPPSHWKKDAKGSWAQKMSPFDNKLLDIRMASSSSETLELTLQEVWPGGSVVGEERMGGGLKMGCWLGKVGGEGVAMVGGEGDFEWVGMVLGVGCEGGERGGGAGVCVARGGECGGGGEGDFEWVEMVLGCGLRGEARVGGGGGSQVREEREEERENPNVEVEMMKMVEFGSIDFSVYRIVFLVLGTLLITLAPTLSESLVFYYSSAMVVGIILVVLVVLFQIGVGSFFLSYLPRLLHTMLTEMGVSEDMYNPVCKFYVIDSEDCLAIFFFLFISLAGAWLGFWVVRRLILTEEGLIDTSVAQFVAWSIRILGIAMVLQCSLDPLLAAEALISAAFISSILRRVARPRLLRKESIVVVFAFFMVMVFAFLPLVVVVFAAVNSNGKVRKAAARSPQKLRDYDSSPTVVKHAEHVSSFQHSKDTFLSPPSRGSTRAASYSTAKGLSNKTPLPTESDTFYSTYHNTLQRRKLSNDEWKLITKNSTKKGLEELVSSPEFSRWAVAHAERITLAPIEKESGATRRWHRWFSWFR
ncbi:Nuclear envelope integral membrane protein 2 [Bienertia sinuspersici]